MSSGVGGGFQPGAQPGPLRESLRLLAADVLPLLNPGDAVAGVIHGDADARRVWVGSAELPLAGVRCGHVVAIGKAAATMAAAALPALEDACREAAGAAPEIVWRGIGVGPDATGARLPGLDWHQGDHPVPGERSFAAGRAVLAFLDEVVAGEPVVFLVSGGGSAVCEQPMPGVSEEELAELHRRLVTGDGLAKVPGIAMANAFRQRLSAIKGGRLLSRVPPGSAHATLLISDVPAGSPEIVASGPTMPPIQPEMRWDEVAVGLGLWPHLSIRTANLLGDDGLIAPSPDLQRRFAPGAFRVVLSERDAERAAVEWLAGAGCSALGLRDLDGLSTKKGLARLVEGLRAELVAHAGAPVAVVSTGEFEVQTGDAVGVGGRNAQLALHAAVELDRHPLPGVDWALLSLGTDGVDGNSPAAGAVADRTSAPRMRAAGIDPEAALLSLDAHTVLNAVGDAVITGPTGTNVRDLRVLVAVPRQGP